MTVRIEWTAKMALGFVCYGIVTLTPTPWPTSRVFMWLLSWAGFYAYDTGYEDYQK